MSSITLRILYHVINYISSLAIQYKLFFMDLFNLVLSVLNI